MPRILDWRICNWKRELPLRKRGLITQPARHWKAWSRLKTPVSASSKEEINEECVSVLRVGSGAFASRPTLCFRPGDHLGRRRRFRRYENSSRHGDHPERRIEV